jgi:hypothetical protein
LEKLRTILRAANIAICVVAILCLLFLFFYVWWLPPLALIIILQLFVLFAFIVFEAAKSRSLARHAIVFVLVLTTIGVGFACTAGVMSSMAPKPRSKMMQK